MEEVWKFIPGFEGYSASSDGRVRNNKTGRVLKARKDEGGYMQIKLSIGRNKQVNKLVHHLVAGAFFPNPNNHPEINHMNKIRHDNRAENLEWISKDGNRAQRQLRPSNDLNGNRTTVWKCDKDTGVKIESYRSLMDAARAVGAEWSGAICNVVKGRQLTAYGFKWVLQGHQEIENEIWKPLYPDLVKGAAGNLISSEGRIKNKAGTVREGYDHSSGYRRICINERDYCVHRLVAQSFLPNFLGLSIVNHKDGNKLNPRLYNLEWVSPSGNVQHAFNTGLIMSRKPVRQFELDGTFVANYRSVADAEAATGCTGIWASATKSTLSGKWRWQFIEEGEDNNSTISVFKGRVRPIRQLTYRGERIADFASISKAAESVGMNRSYFRQWLLQNGNDCKGYIWEFLT